MPKVARPVDPVTGQSLGDAEFLGQLTAGLQHRAGSNDVRIEFNDMSSAQVVWHDLQDRGVKARWVTDSGNAVEFDADEIGPDEVEDIIKSHGISGWRLASRRQASDSNDLTSGLGDVAQEPEVPTGLAGPLAEPTPEPAPTKQGSQVKQAAQDPQVGERWDIGGYHEAVFKVIAVDTSDRKVYLQDDSGHVASYSLSEFREEQTQDPGGRQRPFKKVGSLQQEAKGEHALTGHPEPDEHHFDEGDEIERRDGSGDSASVVGHNPATGHPIALHSDSQDVSDVDPAHWQKKQSKVVTAVTPPSISEKLMHELKAQYPGDPEKAYATAWAIHNRGDGDKK